ncbi:MAG: hypothetical protein U0Y96_14930 [Candidatus Kapaibacterium sp.]|nr:hypothetical protein [Bacteroidota bacterium]
MVRSNKWKLFVSTGILIAAGLLQSCSSAKVEEKPAEPPKFYTSPETNVPFTVDRITNPVDPIIKGEAPAPDVVQNESFNKRVERLFAIDSVAAAKLLDKISANINEITQAFTALTNRNPAPGEIEKLIQTYFESPNTIIEVWPINEDAPQLISIKDYLSTLKGKKLTWEMQHNLEDVSRDVFTDSVNSTTVKVQQFIAPNPALSDRTTKVFNMAVDMTPDGKPIVKVRRIKARKPVAYKP